MPRLSTGLVALILLTSLTLARAADPAPAAPAAAPPAAAVPDPQIKALKKEFSELTRQRDELRRTIEMSEAVATLRKVRDETAKEYADVEKADAGALAARKAQKEALANYDSVLAAKLAASSAPLIKQQGDLEEQRQALLLQDAIIDLKIKSTHSPIQRALDKDADLTALYTAYHAVDPKDKPARDAAKQKYDEARTAKLAGIPEAKALEAERAKIDAALADLDKQGKEIAAKIRAAKDDLRKGADADIKAASAKIAAAQKASDDARDGEKLKTARAAMQVAAKTLRDKVNELLAADPKGKTLATDIDAKSAQITELQKKAK